MSCVESTHLFTMDRLLDGTAGFRHIRVLDVPIGPTRQHI